MRTGISHGSLAMLSKHSLPYDAQRLTAEHRLRADIEDLASANLISANRCQRLLQQAAEAGLSELRSRKPTPSSKNAATAFKRRKLTKSFWPDVYVFKAPVWDRKQQATVTEDLAMWLPLDLLEMIWDLGLPEIILQTDHMDAQTKEHLDALKTELGLPDLLGFGLHGDGVPNNYDRTESCHVLSINLPGVGGQFARLRIPICVLPSSKISDATMDAILEVVAWSLRHLQGGFHPVCRHDGTAWDQKTDKSRSQRHGPLGFHASLVEVRGDWDFYSKVFHFPYHSELEGVCWMCSCKRCQVTSFYELTTNEAMKAS